MRLKDVKAMPNELECFIAETDEEREQVFRLRYSCYRRKRSIEARADELFSDQFDEMPNHFSFLVRQPAEQAMATVRISVVKPERGWRESPGKHVYGDHEAFQQMARESFVEASRLCFAEQA